MLDFYEWVYGRGNRKDDYMGVYKLLYCIAHAIFTLKTGSTDEEHIDNYHMSLNCVQIIFSSVKSAWAQKLFDHSFVASL